MRTVARRGPVDSEPAVPLARSVVPLPHQHPSPHGSTGITESISSSEDNCQEPPLTDITSSSQNDDKDRIVTASDLGSENLLQHHPSIVDRADSRLHGNTTPDFEAKASSSGTESQQIALLREIQTVCLTVHQPCVPYKIATLCNPLLLCEILRSVTSFNYVSMLIVIASSYLDDDGVYAST